MYEKTRSKGSPMYHTSRILHYQGVSQHYVTSLCDIFTEIVSDSAHSSFRHLKFLNLNNTLLETWDDIHELAKFPALTCLRVLGCPLFAVCSLNSFFFARTRR